MNQTNFNNCHIPDTSPCAFVAPNAVVIGDVILKENSSIWYGAVIRADVEKIYIGSFTLCRVL